MKQGVETQAVNGRGQQGLCLSNDTGDTFAILSQTMGEAPLRSHFVPCRNLWVSSVQGSRNPDVWRGALGGPWDLATTYNWDCNRTYNPPKWAYRGYPNYK